MAALKTFDFPPHLLELEIAENIILNCDDLVLEPLQWLSTGVGARAKLAVQLYGGDLWHQCCFETGTAPLLFQNDTMLTSQKGAHIAKSNTDSLAHIRAALSVPPVSQPSAILDMIARLSPFRKKRRHRPMFFN